MSLKCLHQGHLGGGGDDPAIFLCVQIMIMVIMVFAGW